MTVLNNWNPQWKDSIVLAVDPRSTEEEIAADRKKILMNLSIENWKE